MTTPRRFGFRMCAAQLRLLAVGCWRPVDHRLGPLGPRGRRHHCPGLRASGPYSWAGSSRGNGEITGLSRLSAQLLTGFLLTLPFQQRFDRLDELMRGVYAATAACSVAATLALVAPVAMHRVLFRQHRLKVLVSAAHRLAYAGLVLLGLALVGVTLVVFDVVYGRSAATVAGAVALGAFAILWVTLPLLMRRFDEDSQIPSR
jgi:Family of unknown function (DUF6328)